MIYALEHVVMPSKSYSNCLDLPKLRLYYNAWKIEQYEDGNVFAYQGVVLDKETGKEGPFKLNISTRQGKGREPSR